MKNINTNIVEIYVDLKKMRLEAINSSGIVTFIKIYSKDWDSIREYLDGRSNDSNEIAGARMVLYFFKRLSLTVLVNRLNAIKGKL